MITATKHLNKLCLQSLRLCYLMADIFFHEAWWYKLSYQGGSFVEVLLEVKSSSPGNVLSAATRSKLRQIAPK